MLVKSAKLSNFKIKKIIWCFIIDIDATKTSLIVNINRNTVNRYFNLFRLLIYHKQQEEFKRIIKGTVEIIDKESTVVTDFWRGYSGLVNIGY